MKNSIGLVFLVFALLMASLGCGIVSTFVSTSVPPTDTSSPILPSIDKSILFQDGDLPDKITSGNATDAPKWIVGEIPEAKALVYEPLEKNGDFVGGILILLYASNSEAAEAYSAILSKFKSVNGGFSENISTLGEKNAISEIWDPAGHSSGLYGTDIAFIRCNSVVRIRYDDKYPQNTITDYLIAYAKNVDTRVAGSDMCKQ